MAVGRATPVEPLPPKKVFKKANPEIPTLPAADYGKEDYGDSYWSAWPAGKWNNKSPWLNAEAVREIQEETKAVSQQAFDQLVSDILHGVELGCKGDARLPTDCPNNKSAVTHGERLLDVICTWVKSGICSGPFTREELVAELGPDFTVNPMQCAEKSDGKVSRAAPGVVVQ